MDKFNADLDDYRSKTVQSMITLAGKVIAVTGKLPYATFFIIRRTMVAY
jgi:hypothetical protein